MISIHGARRPRGNSHTASRLRMRAGQIVNRVSARGEQGRPLRFDRGRLTVNVHA
jgi:hypothetical protein